MDEIEVRTVIAKLRETLKELDNAPLQEVLDSMLDLVEAAHDNIMEILDASGDDEPDDE